MTEVDEPPDESAPSEVVAQRLQEVRLRRGWSAARVASECARVGAPELTAAVIANIETGRRDKAGKRRRHVTVDEWLALSYVLGVAPVHMLIPIEGAPAYNVAGHWAMTNAAAREWVRGTHCPPSSDRRTWYTERPETEWEPPSEPDSYAEWLPQWRDQAAASVGRMRRATAAGEMPAVDEGDDSRADSSPAKNGQDGDDVEH